jgi:hypothetical protein
MKEIGSMKELELQEQIKHLTREVEATWTTVDKRFLKLRAEIDCLKLEVISLKELLKTEIPSFEERFSNILNETLERVPPE